MFLITGWVLMLLAGAAYHEGLIERPLAYWPCALIAIGLHVLAALVTPTRTT